MKTKLDELKAKQADEIKKLAQEEAIRALLPETLREGASICIHKGFATAGLWPAFRTAKTLADVAPVLEMFAGQIETGEHWRSGCLSTWPAEINSCIRDERAVQDGSHAIEIGVSGGRGFGPDVVVQFWVRLPVGLVEFSLPVSDLWKLVPRVSTSYNQQGDVSRCDIYWPPERGVADSFVGFWSEKPAFKGSYFWADLPNFEAWASNFPNWPKDSAK